ncbi:hypothetical protein Nmel_015194 [Mimus melanotis]
MPWGLLAELCSCVCVELLVWSVFHGDKRQQAPLGRFLLSDAAFVNSHILPQDQHYQQKGMECVALDSWGPVSALQYLCTCQHPMPS